MGIEIWALLALVTVLAAYLLPHLVGRREVMRQAHSQDRYSAELRVLETTAPARTSDEACGVKRHAVIFRQRPEVRAMNRPEVRNVRALRAERELARARRAHAQARARRAVAASRRALVACILLGALLGTAVAAGLSALPWWTAAVPAALLLVSMAAGRRAALRSASADRIERRRLSALRHELVMLTGEELGDEPAAEPRQERAEAADAGAESVSGPDTRLESRHEPMREGTGTGAERTSIEAGSRPAAETSIRSSIEPSADSSIRSSAGSSALATASSTSAVRGSGAAVHGDGSATPVLTALSMPVAEREPAPDVVEQDSPVDFVDQLVEDCEPAAVTPPQGWHPVQVPAPTYTLVASARPRRVDALEEERAPSAPVPLRPTTVRTFTPAEAEVEEAVHAPIDLDAVLRRRRAAGA